MKWWTVVRVAGPVSIGLALVLLRPTWVSVAVLGLLICVAVWLDGQERRADDVEALEEDLRDAVKAETTPLRAGWEAHEVQIKGLAERTREITARLDAMAQQRKGPSL